MCAAVLFPAAAILLAVLGADGVSALLNIPAIIQKGKPVNCSLLIENRSLIPVYGFELKLRVCNTLTGSEKTVTLYRSIAPHSQDSVDITLESTHCGQYLISCDEFRIYDFLGLRGIRKRVEIKEKRVVPPETFSMQLKLSDAESSQGNGESFTLYRKGQDLSEPFQFRDYTVGDSPRQVHWKLSQKLDRYIVSDPSMESTRELVILWDSDSFSSSTSPKIPDALAESLVSMCLALAEDEIPHCVVWKSSETGDIVLKDVDTPDDVYDVMSGILSTNARDTKKAENVRIHKKNKYRKKFESNRYSKDHDVAEKHRNLKDSGNYENLEHTESLEHSKIALISEFLHEFSLREYSKLVYFSNRLPAELHSQLEAKATAFLCAQSYDETYPVNGIDTSDIDCIIFSPDNYRSVMQSIVI